MDNLEYTLSFVEKEILTTLKLKKLVRIMININECLEMHDIF